VWVQVKGTITYDDKTQDRLLGLVTVEDKEYTWVEMGNERMTHGGRRAHERRPPDSPSWPVTSRTLESVSTTAMVLAFF
jgi:hypothetical protein